MIKEAPRDGALLSVAELPFDYTKQLAFHEYELSQAEQRGFPEGQVAYHLGKVTVLQALV